MSCIKSSKQVRQFNRATEEVFAAVKCYDRYCALIGRPIKSLSFRRLRSGDTSLKVR